MPVAVATGRVLQRMRLDAALDPPPADRQVVMGGVRLTDPLEQHILDESQIEQLSVDDLRTASPAVFEQLDRLARTNDRIYVHLDLDVLDPCEVRDLAVFPGNRLEALAGDRRGQHGIRVNDRCRICFVWHDGDGDDVEILDYRSRKGGMTTMSRREPTITELFDEGTAIDEALREAARDARRLHKALGNPMATWKDGQVVWIQPEDIKIDGDPTGTPNRLNDLPHLRSVHYSNSLARLTGDEQKAVKTTAGDSGWNYPRWSSPR